MKFVVDRSKWRCGGRKGKNKVGRGHTSLLNDQGYMCCLGHCALQTGVAKNLIKHQPLPHNVSVYIPALNKKHKTYSWYIDTKLSQKAAEINDDISLTTKQRERKLRTLFSKHKHELVFKGKVAE